MTIPVFIISQVIANTCTKLAFEQVSRAVQSRPVKGIDFAKLGIQAHNSHEILTLKAVDTFSLELNTY
jgi:hypothetical protein